MSIKVFLFLILSIGITFYLRRNNSFEKKVRAIVAEVDQKQKNKYKELEAKGFSDGVVEILEWYDYEYPIVQQYDNYISVKSTDAYNELIKTNPDKVKALFIDNNENIESERELIDIEDISRFKNLEYLKLRSISYVPNGFYKLSKLKVFIAQNSLDDTLDSRITNLKNLEYLEILFTRTVLSPGIAKLEQLKTIRMYNFNTNQPYKQIFSIPNLESLDMIFEDSASLEGISSLKNLRVLISNKVHSEIGDLDLHGLAIHGQNEEAYPEELANLKNLHGLKLANDKVTKPPYFINELINLEYLFLVYSNYDIPEEFTQLPHLKHFEIACKDEYCDGIQRKLGNSDNVTYYRY